MLSNKNTPAPSDSNAPSARLLHQSIVVFICAVILIWFYGFENRFGYRNSFAAFTWLSSSWNAKGDLEHGKFVPFLMLGLVAFRYREIRASVSSGSWWGIAVVIFGCLCYVAACRTLQPRLAIIGLPFMVCGAAYALWGRRVAKFLIFPMLLLWMVIPMPSFQQATTQLQLLATSIAHHGSSLLGVETYTQGTTILPVKGDWKPLSIAHGCSGIRSLMALLMISAAWAYVAKIAIWKKAILFFSALPLAILGNSLRIVSIFVIAEYGNAKWASTTWHDWSGLLLFYPFSMLVLLLIHSVLEGGFPWNKGEVKQIVRRKTSKVCETHSNPS